MTKRCERNPLADRNYAKYEMKTALLDGVFVSEKKAMTNDLQMRRVTKLYDAHDKDGTCYPKATLVEITAPANLSVQAESVLLAILKITGFEGNYAPLTNDSAAATDGHAKEKCVASALTSEYALLRESGLDTSEDAYEQLRKYLRQLSDVRIRYENSVSGWGGQSWFIEHHFRKDGTVLVFVNWRLAGAVFGDYLHALIDLDERRALKSAPAKSLHRWLSACLWAGKSVRISYEKLSSHIWPYATNRMQETRLRNQLLPSLDTLPYWKVVAGEKHAFISHLRRPKTPASVDQEGVRTQ